MIYVDRLRCCIPNRNWPYRKYCHMIADSVEELMDFAKNKLKLEDAWLQKKDIIYNGEKVTTFHYDLTEGKRKLAIKHGAIYIHFYREFGKKILESSAVL